MGEGDTDGGGGMRRAQVGIAVSGLRARKSTHLSEGSVVMLRLRSTG